MSSESLGVDPIIGLNLNGYTIESRIGEGGMGLVYSGVQAEIGKRVAIKVIKADLGDSSDIMKRLIAEARAVNAIRHRGIVDIFGSAKLPDGRQAIIMEFLEGRSLEEELARARAVGRTLPLLEVLNIADEVLNALSAAHQAGVIHRDLKPSNIFLCRGPSGEQHVKLLDFGIAKMGVMQETKASVVLGTPSYMAPEQARGESVSPALDLYAMGIILFEMVTGVLPYTGDTAVRVIYQHLEAPIPLPSSRNPSVPGALDATISKLLSKRSHERHVSADELRRELARLKVALSDPSAMKTIDEPVAPFDARQPLEQTFLKAKPPQPAPTDPEGTGVLPPDIAQRAQATGIEAAPVPPAVVPIATAQPNASAAPVSSQALPKGPSTADLAQSVKKSRGPLWAVAAAAVAVIAGIGWIATRPAPERPPAVDAAVGTPAVAPPVVAAPAIEPAPPPIPEPLEVTPPPVKTVEALPDAPKPIEQQVSAQKKLQTRLLALERRTAKLKKAGGDTELLERQLSMVRTRLSATASPEEFEQLQVALERIAEDLKSN